MALGGLFAGIAYMTLKSLKQAPARVQAQACKVMVRRALSSVARLQALRMQQDQQDDA